MRIARERAAGRVAELGPAELAFSAADCEAYLRLARGARAAARGGRRADGGDRGLAAGRGAGRGAARQRRGAVARAPGRLLRGGGARRPRPRAAPAAARGGDGAGPRHRRRRRPRARAGSGTGAGSSSAAPASPAPGASIRSSAISCAAASRGGDARRAPRASRRGWPTRSRPRGAGRTRSRSGSPARTGTRPPTPSPAREARSCAARPRPSRAGWRALPADQPRAPGADAAGRAARPRPRAGSARPWSTAAPPSRASTRTGRRRSCASPRASRWPTPTSRWATSTARRRSATRSTIPPPTATSRRGRWARWPRSRSRSRAASRRAGPCCDRAFADPVAAAIRGQSPVFEGYYVDLPRAGSTTRSSTWTRALPVFERVDPFGRLPYVLLFKFAIHEERGEDEEALALAARGRELARQTGLAGWIGAGTSIRHRQPARRAWGRRRRRGGAGRRRARAGAAGAPGSSRPRARRSPPRAATRGRRRRPRSAPRASSAIDVPWFDRMRCAALLAPTLVRAGQPGRARAIVEETLAARPPGFSGRAAEAGPGLAAARGGRRGRLGGGAGRRVGGGGRPGPPRGAPRMAARGATAVDGARARGRWTRSRRSARWPTRYPGGAGARALHPPSGRRRAQGGAAVRRGRRAPREHRAPVRVRARPRPGRGRRGQGRARAPAPRPAAARLPPLRRRSSCAAAPGSWTRRSGSAALPRGWCACCSAAPASR